MSLSPPNKINSNTLNGVLETAKQNNAARSSTTGAPYSPTLDNNSTPYTNDVEGYVMLVTKFNEKLHNFTVTNNYVTDFDTKSEDKSQLYILSNRSPELQQVGPDIIDLPPDSAKHQSIIENIRNNLGGCVVYIDNTKRELPIARGDKVKLSCRFGDAAYHCEVISVMKATSASINGVPPKESLKDKAAGGEKYSGDSQGSEEEFESHEGDTGVDTASFYSSQKENARAPKSLKFLQDIITVGKPYTYEDRTIQIDKYLMQILYLLRMEAIKEGVIADTEPFLKPGNGLRSKEKVLANKNRKINEISNALNSKGSFTFGNFKLSKIDGGYQRENGKKYTEAQRSAAIASIGGLEVAFGTSTHESGLTSDIYMGVNILETLTKQKRKNLFREKIGEEEKKIGSTSWVSANNNLWIKQVSPWGKWFFKRFQKYGLYNYPPEAWHFELSEKYRKIFIEKVKAGQIEMIF
jgi:hypothetical protein